MSYHDPEFLPYGAFQRVAGRVRLFKKDSDPPDYRPVAEASKEAAQLGYKLGNAQLQFSKQQYEELMPYVRSIAEQQVDIANQTATQGQDYYEYQKAYRPVEQQMFVEAMQGREGEIDAYDAANQASAADITSDPTSLYQRYQGEIDDQVGRAVADTQGAYTRNANQAIRQGLRYGSGMNGIIANVANLGMAQARAQASAANSAREAGIEGVRGRIARGLQLRMGNMGAKNAQKAIDWAKKLDAAGLVKGMPGASQGAYGLAINAGNSASANFRAPGQDYLAGMQAGNGTIMQGQGLKVQGLSNVLNAQTQFATADDGSGAVLGAGIGVVGTVAAAFI